MKAISFFSDSDKEQIRNAVQAAEKMTSGEIRIYIEDKAGDNVMDRAAFVFAELRMHMTKQRNGVLIYFALQDRKFAVIGDNGIHSIVGQDFWNSVKEHMLALFKQEKFVEGLVAGITEAGNVLKKHFPYDGGDRNELSDEIIVE